MPLEKLSESIRGRKDAVGGESGVGQDPGTTDTVPVVPHKVLYADVPFYHDAECTRMVEDARIAILRPLDPDGFDELEVVPSRKQYQAGQYLSWQLNKDNLWEDCYYRNPRTGEVEKAFTLHVEFVGNVLTDEAVAGDRERIEKLEALYADQDTETVM